MTYEEYKKRPVQQIIAEEVQRQLQMEAAKAQQLKLFKPIKQEDNL